MRVRRRTTPRSVRVARAAISVGVFATLFAPWAHGRACEGFGLLLLFSLGLGLFTGLVGAFLELWFFASWGVVLMNAEPGQGALAQLRVGLAVLAVNVIANPRYFHGPPLADNWGYRACAVLLVTGAAFEGVLLASTLVSPRFLARRP